MIIKHRLPLYNSPAKSGVKGCIYVTISSGSYVHHPLIDTYTNYEGIDHNTPDMVDGYAWCEGQFNI